MASTQDLPKTYRALVLSSTNEPPQLRVVPTPEPAAGNVIVRMLLVNVLSYLRDIYNGTRKYPFPTPLVIGTGGIGRIAAIGPDTTRLQRGQLVFVDSYIRGRDDPTASILFGIHEGYSEGSRKLMRGEWRDATFAEYAKVPLENCHVLDEPRLLGSLESGGLGYKIEDLADLPAMTVPYGGLRDIGLKAGETVIVAPATGPFGGAAVRVAVALGARVIAMGRNPKVLERIAAANERVESVQITGDEEADTKALQKFGPIDAYFDISPGVAAHSTHIKSGILALKNSGRVSLMGGIQEDISIPYSAIMYKSLQLKGRYMYEREGVRELIKMIEVGVLALGKAAGEERDVVKFALEDWDKAFTAAAETTGKTQALIAP